ncbi:MAG: VOC family protein [Nannocystis sp.]|nr:VOC family protein [Nannocystis sp.]
MTTSAPPPFHLAFPIHDLEATRAFYRDVLGCGVGREAERWIDLDLYGHQLSAHLVDRGDAGPPTNRVDGDDVPVRHFGCILEWEQWHRLAERIRAARIPFLIEPHIRFQGEPGEQATMFFQDPSGNALEFKAFRDPAAIFAR